MAALSHGQFRNAMSRLGAAVNVITSGGEAGRLGFTATAVCSVSAEPPTLLVCMNRSSLQSEALHRNGVVCVNTLAHEHHDLGAIFAGVTGAKGDARFASGKWGRLTTGAPVLLDALAAFDCSIERTIEVGTHSVILCTVLDVSIKEQGDPLFYFDRQYCSMRPLGPPDPGTRCVPS